MALAIASSERGWWEAHKAGSFPAFRLYAEAEQEAERIQVFEPEYIPGLLQTEIYIRALQEAFIRPTPRDVADAVVAFRLQRQKLIYSRARLPRIEMIIGAQAIACLDDSVQDEQIHQLRERAKLGVEIRVATGLHPAMGSMFTVLTPPANDGPPFVYMDAMDGCRYVEDHDVVSEYHRSHVRAMEVATPLERYLNDR